VLDELRVRLVHDHLRRKLTSLSNCSYRFRVKVIFCKYFSQK
jgi:hypothetical protein